MTVRPHLPRAVAALCVLLVASACEPEPSEASITLTANPATIDDQGQPTTLKVEVTFPDGFRAEGPLTFRATAGSFAGEGREATIQLSNGRGSASWRCEVQKDAGCKGALTLEAEWRGQKGTTMVTVEGDGPVNPGGTLTLTPVRPAYVIGADEPLEIGVVLTGTGGAPISGASLTATTNLGLLGDSPTAASGVNVQLTTGLDGAATFWLRDSGTPGTATIRVQGDGVEKTLSVNLLAIQQVAHTSTQCNNVACTVMGVKGSGFNEQATVTFTVKDQRGQPVVDVPVRFSIPNAPAGTIVSETARTDATGKAAANVVAGATIGAFTVKAVVVDGEAEGQSATIGIRGARASNRNLSLSCARINIPAWANATPGVPLQQKVDCTVKVVDRFNNSVGTGTSVRLLTEAGSVPSSIPTKAFVATGNNDDEGWGTFEFNTAGRFPPVDVPPLPADNTQEPVQRMAEPSWQEGSQILNPRDGLVTLVALLRGEEHYDDLNANGQWDPGEPFLDQGEPFVDENDNGVYDPGETYIDEAPANNRWDGPNGQWDQDTSIWVETRLLYSGRPVGDRSSITPAPFAGACGSGSELAKGASTAVQVRFRDPRGNPPSAGTRFTTAETPANKGTISGSGTQLDTFGMEWTRLQVDAETGVPCTSAHAVCEWQVQFRTWDALTLAPQISGAPANNTTACELATFTIGAEMLGEKLGLLVTGGIL